MRIRLALAAMTLAARAAAQTIAPADFLPLGPGAQWLYERSSGGGPTQVRLNVVDVNQASSGTRYLVEVPFEGVSARVRLEFATDGRLLLRAFEAKVNDIFDDLPFDPEATADVQLNPPALLGDAMLMPVSAVTQTPVDTEVDADLDTGVGSIDLDIHVTGNITATWLPAEPVDTPPGRFDDVVRLAIDIQLRFVEDVFDDDVTVTQHIDGILARHVGFVQLRHGDGTYGLLRAVVGGVPIGDFPQYEDLVWLHFVVPPLLTLHDRASGEAVAADLALHDIRLTQTIYGHGHIDAVVDHPTATGVPVFVKGKARARKDGGAKLELEGKVVVVDLKVKLKMNQKLYPGETTLGLVFKVGKTKTTVPITVAPLPASAVDVRLDGFVDTATGNESERKLSSEGELRIGEVAYPITCKETLKVKNNGVHKRTYKFRQTGNDTVVIVVEAKSTSAADFTINSLKPKLFKLEIGKKKVSGVVADVVAPQS